MMSSRFLLLLALASGLGAASSSACAVFPLGVADHSATHAASVVEVCPLGVPWTQIATRRTEEGIAVTLSTTPERVAELRRRARQQARASGPHRHVGDGHNGVHRGPRAHGLRLWAVGAITTNVVDTDVGATLEVTPVDPVQQQEIRERVERRVATLQAARCPT